ncbi:MAG: DUF4249 domain-containing protein [Melioribacteraceae bacterium]|nr:DUF4249 domain-containing protein [Melioribacteraceae bacterium]
MRKYLFLIIIFISIISCEENLNPYGELKERYILNCIIRGDTTFQTLTLTRDYQVDNFDPYSNKEDVNIKNALVRIWNGNNKVTILRDTTIERPVGDKYKTPYTVFKTNDLLPNPNSAIEIEAILPNGKKLTSVASVPDAITISEGSSDKVIPPVDNKKFIKISWSTSEKNPVFIVRLAIYFFKHENGVKTRNVLTVPLNYIQYGEAWIPNYPKPVTDLAYSVDMNTIKKAMELISDNDTNKSRYEILSCIFEVLSLDPELRKYYFATARSRDIYSVKLDETDYTNIKGGYGVFGVYMRTYWVLRFTHDYIKSFGYTPGLTDVK